MAFQTCQLDELPTQVEGTPQTTKKMYDVSTVGVDVMKIALPRYEQSLGSFVNSISHAVSAKIFICSCYLSTLNGHDGM